MDRTEYPPEPGIVGYWTERAIERSTKRVPVASCIDRNIEKESTAAMARAHSQVFEILDGVTGGIRHLLRSEEELGSLERIVKQFNRMIVQTPYEQCNSCAIFYYTIFLITSGNEYDYLKTIKFKEQLLSEFNMHMK